MSKNCSCHGEGGRTADPVMGILTRPRYSPGLILEDSDLTAAVEYTRELNRLLFRSLFGCGVVCGLKVTLDEDCGLTVMVSPGLALDGCGDPLQLVGSANIKLEAKDGVILQRDQTAPTQRDFWVIACGKEKNCAPRALVCDSDDLDGAPQPTRTRSAVEISISFQPPECICGCKPFDPKTEDQDALETRANALMAVLDREATERTSKEGPREYGCGTDRYGCQREHYTNPDCPADCGCGTACACGCCVLLAWVHWAEREKNWRVLHKGVRRFVRPCLMDDPIVDGRAADQTTGDEGVGRETPSANDRPVGVGTPERVETVDEKPTPRAANRTAVAPKPSDGGGKGKGKAPPSKSTDKPQ